MKKKDKKRKREKLERKMQKRKEKNTINYCWYSYYIVWGTVIPYLIGLFYTLIMLNCMETSPILLPATYLIQENAKTMQMAPRKIRKLYPLKKSKTTTITAAACKQ